MKRVFSAGGIVVKDGKYLITKPRPSLVLPKERFVLPKGIVEEGEETEKAALREVFEETGVRAVIIKKIGYTKFPWTVGQEKFFKIVTFYLMGYQSGELTTNEEVSGLYWLEYDEARKKLTSYGEKKLLDKAKELLGTVSPGSSAATGNFEGGGAD